MAPVAIVRAVARALRARSAGHQLRLHRQETFSLHLLAGELAGTANCLRLLPSLLFRGFFVMAAKLHLAENALPLHLFLQRLESLVDVVVTDENLHASFLLNGSLVCRVLGRPKSLSESGRK